MNNNKQKNEDLYVKETLKIIHFFVDIEDILCQTHYILNFLVILLSMGVVYKLKNLII